MPQVTHILALQGSCASTYVPCCWPSTSTSLQSSSSRRLQSTCHLQEKTQGAAACSIGLCPPSRAWLRLTSTRQAMGWQGVRPVLVHHSQVQGSSSSSRRLHQIRVPCEGLAAVLLTSPSPSRGLKGGSLARLRRHESLFCPHEPLASICSTKDLEPPAESPCATSAHPKCLDVQDLSLLSVSIGPEHLPPLSLL